MGLRRPGVFELVCLGRLRARRAAVASMRFPSRFGLLPIPQGSRTDKKARNEMYRYFATYVRHARFLSCMSEFTYVRTARWLVLRRMIGMRNSDLPKDGRLFPALFKRPLDAYG